MADGVAITAGSGTTILTDDTASGHVQVNKLAISTDGSATLIPATADGLGVLIRTETANGPTVFRSTTDLDETEEQVKATAGQVYGYMFHNVSTSWRYLKWYNGTAATVVVGTTTPLFIQGLPPTSAGHISFDHGIPFSTAITVAATTGVADTDVTGPTTNDVAVTVLYK
ncbi:MAG: hypothetical protein H0U59_13295 [Gemmatimonadaceae bacterium]|nr:hypothetical protein [Gemmatimonadaceae bacterium]